MTHTAAEWGGWVSGGGAFWMTVIPLGGVSVASIPLSLADGYMLLILKRALPFRPLYIGSESFWNRAGLQAHSRIQGIKSFNNKRVWILAFGKAAAS